ncbi:MAG: signal recognition particle-docking protein FtsY, partial [Thermoleophilia bacterium]
MTLSWAELLGDVEPSPDPAEETAGFLKRLRGSLSRGSRALRERLPGFDPGQEESWEALEEALIVADVGLAATEILVDRLRRRRQGASMEEALVEEVASLLTRPRPLALSARPSVILVVGVNGSGKTTTIGKLAYRLREHGRSVVVAAADTFRAA